MKVLNKTGYSENTYKEYIGTCIPRILIGYGAEKRMVFDKETKKPTNQIDHMRINVYFPKMGTQVIKLPSDFKFPSDIDHLAEIELIAPEACVINK